MAAWLSLAALTDEARHGSSDRDEHELARRLTRWLASKLSGLASTSRPQRQATPATGNIALQLMAAFKRRAELDPAQVELIDQALILCADHELNASTFAVRVAASTGASIAASLLAGLSALSGPRHGGAAEKMIELVDDAERTSAERAVGRWLAREQPLPGFGHPLYPAGDPRARASRPP